jgi:hypothetical protein
MISPCTSYLRSENRAIGLRHALLMIAAIGTVACSADQGKSVSPTGLSGRRSLQLRQSDRHNVAPEEATIIDSIRALYSTSADGDAIRIMLSDATARDLRSSNAKVQPLLNRLNAIRSARADSIVAAGTSAARSISPATLVLVDKLSDSTASAVVWHRKNRIPVDLILLRSDRASSRTFGAAVTVLSRVRAILDTSSSTNDIRVVVHGERMPKSWAGSLEGPANRDLDALKKSAPSFIAGLGMVRSKAILIGR